MDDSERDMEQEDFDQPKQNDVFILCVSLSGYEIDIHIYIGIEFGFIAEA